MFTPAQVVPGADNAEQDGLMTGSLGLEEARMYKSEPDLRIKSEPSAFSEVTNYWLQCSMQLGDTQYQTHARDPFLCARDPFASFHEQMDNLEWRPPVLQAMALCKQESASEVDEMLISQTQNACQLGARKETSESQCKVFMPSYWDQQFVNDCEPWYDHLENPRGKPFVGGPRNGIFKSENANSFFKEEDPTKDETDMVQDRDSESPASFTSVDSPPEFPWNTRTIPGSRTSDISAFSSTEQKFVMHKNHKTTFKSGRPRLCQFLLELLNHPDKYGYMIDWIDKEKGVFKFINSSEVARLWGNRRNKPSMKYENFARSLRTYIAKGILAKPRSKLVYQFARVKS
ncbi:SAM pointed domain-containing Ets transcription factor-like isoform X2 [Pocillopora verrucosa]|nr:SAM pointed domain-containing Ets transcription factor-like isoform X2 [Pocillopora verrucosa]